MPLGQEFTTKQTTIKKKKLIIGLSTSIVSELLKMWMLCLGYLYNILDSRFFMK